MTIFAAFLIGSSVGCCFGLVLGSLFSHSKRTELEAELQREQIRNEILESVVNSKPNLKMVGHLVQPPRWEETRN